MAQGYLQVDVFSAANHFPIPNATVSVSRSDTPEDMIEKLMTDSSGQTENVLLEAPPEELSLRPESENR